MGGREGVGAENSLFLSRSHSSYGAHLLNLTNPPTVTQSESGQRGKRKRTVSFGADKRPEKCYGPSLSPSLPACLPVSAPSSTHSARNSLPFRSLGHRSPDRLECISISTYLLALIIEQERMNLTESVIAAFMEF